jgi:hypothetical protein
MDAWFRVAVPGNNDTAFTDIQVGSEEDPIYLSSLTSNGDDILEGKDVAQVSKAPQYTSVHQTKQSKAER